MANPPSPRRMPLRQLLTHAEKHSRDVIEHTQTSLVPAVVDFFDLTRPVRHQSHYPTMVSVVNAMNRLQSLLKESTTHLNYLQEQLHEICEHARRERLSRR